MNKNEKELILFGGICADDAGRCYFENNFVIVESERFRKEVDEEKIIMLLCHNYKAYLCEKSLLDIQAAGLIERIPESEADTTSVFYKYKESTAFLASILIATKGLNYVVELLRDEFKNHQENPDDHFRNCYIYLSIQKD